MAKIERRRRHGKSPQDAKSALAAAVTDIAARVPGGGPKPEWNDDRSSVAVNGDMFSAVMTVDDAQVNVVVDLSFLASFMKGTIAAEVDKTLDTHFPTATG